MVAVADEGADACGVQPRQPLDELQLRPQAAVRSVVDVACHQQRVDVFPETEVDDVPVGIEGGAVESIGNVFGRLAADPPEGAVQVKVGGVDESKFNH